MDELKQAKIRQEIAQLSKCVEELRSIGLHFAPDQIEEVVVHLKEQLEPGLPGLEDAPND